MLKKALFEYQGQMIYEYTIETSELRLSILNYGGVITQLIKKKSQQKQHNLVVNYSDYRDYLENPFYLGAMIGRVAGRTFPSYYYNYLGKKVKLLENEGESHLHGGSQGYHNQFWQVREYRDNLNIGLVLSYVDQANPNGYEGKVTVQVSYLLRGNQFTIETTGTVDQPLPLNLTNHSYFNLNYHNQQKTILNHQLLIDGPSFQEVTADYLPTGRYIETNNHVLGFTEAKTIGEVLNSNHEQLVKTVGGIDLAYLLNKSSETPQIILTCPDSQTQIEVYTSAETVVVYTCNKHAVALQGEPLKKYQGITLETQRRPNYLQQDNRPEDYYSVDKPYYEQTKFVIS